MAPYSQKILATLLEVSWPSTSAILCTRYRAVPISQYSHPNAVDSLVFRLFFRTGRLGTRLHPAQWVTNIYTCWCGSWNVHTLRSNFLCSIRNPLTETCGPFLVYTVAEVYSGAMSRPRVPLDSSHDSSRVELGIHKFKSCDEAILTSDITSA